MEQATSRPLLTPKKTLPPGSTGGSGASTHFAFQHKIFSVDRAYFSLTHDSREPVFHVPLGDLNAALTLPTLRFEFSIAPDSGDGKLLDLIEKSLRYVKEIRPQDSIPCELLDGSASWCVEARHRQIAQSRLAVQLSAWVNKEEVVITDVSQLEQLADDPATKTRVQKAIAEIAERIGIGYDRRQEVVDKIDLFARELAYIEALRELQGGVRMIFGNLTKLAKVYVKEKSVTEDIVRVLQLLRAPIADLDATFALVDAQTADIMSILKNYDSQANYVREVRDDLHFRLRDWHGLSDKWAVQELIRSSESEALIKETYRFAAHNFPQQQSWRR
ncbi:MAG: hypothetical protein JWL84_3496 [Rhodospirillales bacterium]|jgi:hypothetical protein|nr:hypothetical protein [Rhodospirillales bacterium]